MSRNNERFVEFMDRLHPVIVHEMLQSDGTWKRLPSSHLVSMNHGEDGNSLLCGVCGSFMYVELEYIGQTLCATCSGCHKAIYRWSPRKVLCACPDHSEPGGCSNAKCWKHTPRQ